MSAVNTQSKGIFIASWVRFTNLNCWNCPQKLSAQLRVPSKSVGGTPLIPPLDGGFTAGVAVVTFTDIVFGSGGSRGSDPCSDTTGSSVAANALSSGHGTAIVCLLSLGMAVVGPQFSSGFTSDPDSDIMGDRFRGAVRSVVCTWITWVGSWVWLSVQRPKPTFGSLGSMRYEEHDLNMSSVLE